MRSHNRTIGGMIMLDIFFYIVTVVVIIGALMKMDK